MLLLDVQTQELPAKILQTHIEKSRLAHTYLLTGGGTEEQVRLAAAFAVSLFAGDADSSQPLIQKKIDEKNHPDLKWMGEDLTEKNLKIEEVRDMIAWSVMRPFEASWKVFVICAAERLTVQAQNALLKTLEEPPAHTVYMLLVESKANLLDTIRSRAFELRLNPADDVSQSTGEVEVPEGFGQKKWADFFEDYQGLNKPELHEFLDALIAYFRYLSSASAYRADVFHAWLQIIDCLCESKGALQSNANQKLVMTRLAVKFKQLLPHPQWLEPVGG